MRHGWWLALAAMGCIQEPRSGSDAEDMRVMVVVGADAVVDPDAVTPDAAVGVEPDAVAEPDAAAAPPDAAGPGHDAALEPDVSPAPDAAPPAPDVAPVPAGPLAIELTWRTPGDANEADGEGSDVDLHLLHPSGVGFSLAPLDLYYANPGPDWGAPGPEHDASLDIDDTNGAGPELITAGVLEETEPLGGGYLVGVHYYRSENFLGGGDWGHTFARLRVLADGEVVFDSDAEWGPEGLRLNAREETYVPVALHVAEGVVEVEALPRVRLAELPRALPVVGLYCDATARVHACAPRHRCVDEQCEPRDDLAGPEGECEVELDCQIGLRCVEPEGVCAGDSDLDGRCNDAPEGRRCVEGLYCLEVDGVGACAAPVDEGDACDPERCAAGLACRDGVCGAPIARGEPCEPRAGAAVCVEDAYCRADEEGGGVCSDFQDVGEPCDDEPFGVRCAPDQSCEFQEGVPIGVCRSDCVSAEEVLRGCGFDPGLGFPGVCGDPLEAAMVACIDAVGADDCNGALGCVLAPP